MRATGMYGAGDVRIEAIRDARIIRSADRTTNIDGVPDGYRSMNERKSIKVKIEF